MWICENCGKEFDIDYRKDELNKRKHPVPRFCSRKCANRRNSCLWTEAQKEKFKESLKGDRTSYLCKSCGNLIGIGWRFKHRCYCDNCRKPRKERNKNIKICPVCGKEFFGRNKTCSHSCAVKIMGGVNPVQERLKKDLMVKWLNGEDVSSQISFKSGLGTGELSTRFKKRIKKFLLEIQNHKCSICGCGDIWADKPLVFILDHIDGNWENQKRDNFRLICPNCNSQLDTTGNTSKTRGRGRLSSRWRRNATKRDSESFLSDKEKSDFYTEIAKSNLEKR
jgi:hypothetical protein